jgi:hypothetical protein
MPIKDKTLYPKDWPEIRKRILEREGHKCKFCALENGAVGYRDKEGVFHYSEAYLLTKQRGYGFYQTSGYLKIVLTVAHLNHDTKDNSDINLASLCQRCHLNHDKHFHKANAAQTRRKKKGLQELF